MNTTERKIGRNEIELRPKTEEMAKVWKNIWSDVEECIAEAD